MPLAGAQETLKCYCVDVRVVLVIAVDDEEATRRDMTRDVRVSFTLGFVGTPSAF